MPAIRREKTNKQNRSNPMGGGTIRAPSAGGAAGAPVGAGSATLGGMSLPTNKKHGQHLLKNPGIIEKIVVASDIKPSDTVFEIGPGTGNLTMRLLENAKRVVAHEIDPRMAAEKEFAERLIAKVGEKQYGRLAVNTALFVKVSCVCKVSRGSFTPPPEVDSMVVKVVPRDPPIEVDFREWDGLMRICFSRKRKTLRSSFCTKDTMRTLEDNYKTWCALKGEKPNKQPMKDKALEALNALGLAEQRAIRIDLDTYFRLLLEFNRRGIHFSNCSAGARIGDSADDAKMAGPSEEFFLDDGAEDDGGDEDMEED